MQTSISTVFIGPLCHSLSREEAVYLPQGALVVSSEGLIEACGPWATIQQQIQKPIQLILLPAHHWMIPGLIDLHTHLPQYEAVGYPAPDLLTWLQQSIYPAEKAFCEPSHAKRVSQEFFKSLLRHGTTTAAVFLSSHPEASELAFQAAQQQGNRVVMGLNLMDINAPDDLLQTTAALLTQTETLYHRWHSMDNGRLQYAWMPRFALTSSENLLEGVGLLRKQYPNAYLHTHLSEQASELQAVKTQFPWATHYTGVYDAFGLLGKRTLFAHGIHLSPPEVQRIQETHTSLVHCPSSNLFLKSGAFPWFDRVSAGISFGLGSDVGAGPELSLFKVMKEAQYIQTDQQITPQSLFYTATLGGAEALGLASQIGNFEPGKEADFIILNSHAKPELQHLKPDTSLSHLLSSLIYLGDDRMVVQTYVRGKQVYGEELP